MAKLFAKLTAMAVLISALTPTLYAYAALA